MFWLLILIPLLSPADTLTGIHFSSPADTMLSIHHADSLDHARYVEDSLFISAYEVKSHYAFLLRKQQITYDIQQLRRKDISTIPRVLFIIPLLLIAAARIGYPKDFLLLWQSLANKQAEQQQSRSASKRLSFFAFILYLNFSFVMSMYVVLANEYLTHQFYLQPMFSITVMTFLFTFFLALKSSATRLTGYVFNCSDSVDEYLITFFNVVKMVGISVFPAVVFLSFQSSLLSFSILIVTFFLFVLSVCYLLIRGLSTFYSFLYSGIFHGIMYICLQEVMPLLLLIKLLTKTIH